MRSFLLVRSCDVSGVSGTGIVAEGVEFTDGTVVLHWLRRPHGTGLYASLDDMLEVHGHGGSTCVRWIEYNGGGKHERQHLSLQSPQSAGSRAELES